MLQLAQFDSFINTGLTVENSFWFTLKCSEVVSILEAQKMVGVPKFVGAWTPLFGKSSLVTALLNRDKTIVGPTQMHIIICSFESIQK